MHAHSSRARAVGRMQAIQSPVVPIVAGWLAENPDAISMAQGMVSYGPPPQIFPAASESLREPALSRYSQAKGSPELLDAIVRKLRQDNAIEYSPDVHTLMVTAGANMAFVNAILAITRPGDEVILPIPYYFNHEMALRMLGVTPVPVACDENYLPSAPALTGAITARTRAIVTISPGNPSGMIYPKELHKDIVQLCSDAGLWHIRDEAYEYFRYDGSSTPPPGPTSNTIYLYSLSKTYGFAGWRIGYVLAPIELNDALVKAQDSNLICAPGINQRAAAACLDIGADYCRTRLPALQSARDKLLEALKVLPPQIQCNKPEGAFYVMVRIDKAMDAMQLAKDFVFEHGVGVLPGDAFGLSSECSLRLSYGALDEESLAVGIDRLCAALLSICD